MKARQYINMMGMAAAVLLSSCVKDTRYDTPHPDYGKIAVTADWSARGEGIDIPATWTVTMGDYTGTETSATHAPDHLFAPGSYTLAVWNPAEGITVNGTTATVAAATGNRAGADAFVNNAPGWFFTYTKQVTIEKDKDYPLTAAMKQQVRELTLVVEPTGDAARRITEIVAHLTGAAGTLGGFAVDVYLSFLDLQRIAGQAYATFYIVFTTVNGAYDNVTVHSRIGTDEVTSGIVVQIIDGTLLLACQAVHIHLVGIRAFSFFVSKGIEVCLLEVGGYRVACREVEHHNVVQFHFAEARYTFVFPLGPFDVRLGVEYR